MKKLLLLISLLIGGMSASFAQDGGITGTFNGAPNKDVAVSLNLTNPSGFEACAFQCDIELPSGVTANKVSGTDNYDVATSSADHVVASNVITDGGKTFLRIICYSMSNATLTNGAVASFNVHCDETIAAGKVNFTISNIELADQNSVSQNSGISSGITGDVNGDGLVTVTDILAIINVINNVATNPNADTNGDGIVTVTDILFVINVINNK